MCGRYNLIATGQQIIGHFRLLSLSAHNLNYNIPPGQKIFAIVQLEDGSRDVNLHGGLIIVVGRSRNFQSFDQCQSGNPD